MFDVDIDFADRNVLLEKLKHRVAKLENGKKHNTGVYFTEIPHDPATNLSTLDYETAEDRNYFKLDCLNVSIYKNVKDNDHLNKLMTTKPVWELLEAKEFSDQVFHLNGHNDILKTLGNQYLAGGGYFINPINKSSNKLEGLVILKKDMFKKGFNHLHICL